MKQKRNLLAVLMFFIASHLFAITPIEGLLERIDKGASRRIITETVRSDCDFFEIVTYVFQRCTIQMCDAQT